MASSTSSSSGNALDIDYSWLCNVAMTNKVLAAWVASGRDAFLTPGSLRPLVIMFSFSLDDGVPASHKCYGKSLFLCAPRRAKKARASKPPRFLTYEHFGQEDVPSLHQIRFPYSETTPGGMLYIERHAAPGQSASELRCRGRVLTGGNVGDRVARKPAVRTVLSGWKFTLQVTTYLYIHLPKWEKSGSLVQV